MCFHISQTKIGRELEERYKAKLHLSKLRAEPPFFYHINGFVHPDILMIPQEEPSVITDAIWGIAPENEKIENLTVYFKKAVAFGGGLNAQFEKAFTHFIYKKSIISKRCLIPVTGFYEPHERKGKKFPYFISRKDGDSFSLAGIYTQIGEIFSCSILTKEASPMFQEIHNVKKRQPVIINKKDEELWLNDQLSKPEIHKLAQVVYPEETLIAFPVNKKIFQPGEDSNTPESQKYFDYPELQELF